MSIATGSPGSRRVVHQKSKELLSMRLGRRITIEGHMNVKYSTHYRHRMRAIVCTRKNVRSASEGLYQQLRASPQQYGTYTSSGYVTSTPSRLGEQANLCEPEAGRDAINPYSNGVSSGLDSGRASHTLNSTLNAQSTIHHPQPKRTRTTHAFTYIPVQL